MKCPLCKDKGIDNDLILHISLEPEFSLRKGDKETALPQIVAIQCKSDEHVFPVGEVLFKTIELIYWATIQHLERTELLHGKLAHEIAAEGRSYMDTMKLLQATLDEAVRRYKSNTGYHPT